MQLLAIRQLGPTMLAAIMPLRLLSSIAGSGAVLGEHVSGALEALGLLLVGVTACCYLGHQVLVSRRTKTKPSRAAPGPATAEEVPAPAPPATELTSV